MFARDDTRREPRRPVRRTEPQRRRPVPLSTLTHGDDPGVVFPRDGQDPALERVCVPVDEVQRDHVHVLRPATIRSPALDEDPLAEELRLGPLIALRRAQADAQDLLHRMPHSLGATANSVNNTGFPLSASEPHGYAAPTWNKSCGCSAVGRELT